MNNKIKKGDIVKMNDKYYVSAKNKKRTFIATADEQKMCGTMVVWLDGYRGCYAANGLDVIY